MPVAKIDSEYNTPLMRRIAIISPKDMATGVEDERGRICIDKRKMHPLLDKINNMVTFMIESDVVQSALKLHASTWLRVTFLRNIKKSAEKTLHFKAFVSRRPKISYIMIAMLYLWSKKEWKHPVYDVWRIQNITFRKKTTTGRDKVILEFGAYLPSDYTYDGDEFDLKANIKFATI